jgi:glutamate racemase
MHTKTITSKNPIGIFDSGIGGLTVAKAIVERLPHESIIYFGDTVHLPYGDKSAATIQGYARSIVDMLLAQGCKMIVIACNSASAAAYDFVKEYVGKRALVLNVVDPMIAFLQKQYADNGKRVGLIGTKQTVNSQIYPQKLAALQVHIDLCALATPLLVPAIEEGFSEHEIIDHLLREYLSRPELRGINALVLGCTHYPVIRDKIARFYANQIEIIDSSPLVAREVEAQLVAHNLLHDISGNATRSFYVSDLTTAFADKAKLFFGKDVRLEKKPL